MTSGEVYRDVLRRDDFIVDQELRTSVRNETASNNEGTHIVGRKISGRFFDSVDLSIEPNSTVVIIGDNARGRDELLQVIAGILPPKGGNIHRNETTRLEYVTPTFSGQEIENIEHKTIRELFYEARGIKGMEDQIGTLYQLGINDPKALDAAGKLQITFEALGGYEASTEIEQILDGLNVRGSEHDDITSDTNVTSLSSGQISKIIIGKALFSRAGVIAMDDPSVHLDVRSKKWLENYINTSKQTIVVSTSDIEFAKNIATKVAEVTSIGPVIQCTADFATFIHQRDRILAQWEDEANLKLKEIQEKRAHVKEFLGPLAVRSSSLGQTKKTTETLIARMESEYGTMPGKKMTEQKSTIKDCYFEAEAQSSKEVVVIDAVKIFYESQGKDTTLEVVDLSDITILRGDKLAIIGRNGSGKSTLLKALGGLDSDMAVEGSIDIATNATKAYYSPYTALPTGKTVTIPNALEAAAGGNASIGKIMEYWGFKRSDYFNTPVDALRHNDEKARLQMALIMASKSNLIILDEPTSYLTPLYRERLIKALNGYKGTLLIVSHDPDFLQELSLNGTLSMPEGILRKKA